MIAVFGSLNMDLVVNTPRFAQPGETLTAHDFMTVPGGKGANQAVACARLLHPVRMFGRVGSDAFGNTLCALLVDEGIETSAVISTPEVSSGIAVICVDESGQNTILIVPGANGAMSSDDVLRLEAALDTVTILLLQLEIPLEVVVQAARSAHQRGVTVILDPAPAQHLPDDLYQWVDVLTPNQSEAAALVGFPLDTPEAVASAAHILVERGAKRAIIKLGERGAYWYDGAADCHLRAFPVNAIDTVAAGDAFNGGLAAALAEGAAFASAVRWGMACGALSATKRGAQPSLPTKQEVEDFLRIRKEE